MSDKETIKVQKAFMNIVNEMIKKNVNLPKEFELYYVITEHQDRKGLMVNIHPYLTKTLAEANCEQPTTNSNEGKYDWCSKHTTIVDSTNNVRLENYCTDNTIEHVVDYQLKNTY